MKERPLILVRGGGDLATGVVHRLWSAGLRVLVLESEHPAAIRRQVSLCEAVYAGQTQVEGLRAVRIHSLAEAAQVWQQGAVPVLVDPEEQWTPKGKTGRFGGCDPGQTKPWHPSWHGAADHCLGAWVYGRTGCGCGDRDEAGPSPGTE